MHTHSRKLAKPGRGAADVYSAMGGLLPEALEFLQSAEKCDLVLIDRQMAGMDSLSLASQVRQLPSRNAMPLILLNSLADGATRPEFVANVNKPLKPDRLFNALDRLFVRHAATPTSSGFPINPTAAVLASSLRAFMVEDNLVNQPVAMMLLAKLGVHPRVANNGAEALAAFSEQPYEFILMDMEMPVMDGCEATRLIREREDGKQVWIVALTANAMVSDCRRAFDAGMNDFVFKPIRLSDPESAFKRAAGSTELYRAPAVSASAA